jgi:hypothetical protein
VQKLIRRGNFSSKQMLKTRIEQFIAYFNATMASQKNESFNSARMY